MSQRQNSTSRENLIEIEDLKVNFLTYKGVVKALDGVSLSVKRGEIFGLVGESGCGKSVTALAIEGLLPDNAQVTGGKILFDGKNLLESTPEEKRRLRASRMAIVFQDPSSFLNPVLTVRQQLEEIFTLNKGRLGEIASSEYPARAGDSADGYVTELSNKSEVFSRDFMKSLEVSILKQVGLPDPERILGEYPHQLSGGMRQRVMIAFGLARNPDLLIADEITTALDVTIQAQIVELLRELRKKFSGSVLLITHDLGIIAELCDRVGVMYAGNIVELTDVYELFRNPKHPYTQGLMRSIPNVGHHVSRLETVRGSVPDLINPPSGCRFHPRCPYSFEKCKSVKPQLRNTITVGTTSHSVACHLYEEGETRH